MTTRLRLYSGALRLLGERKLGSLSENRPSRRYLDDVWDDGAVDLCLAAGQWMFPSRTIMLTYSPSITPSFGYRRAFDKPTDHIRTLAISADEYFGQPLLKYQQEGAYWYADDDNIYIRYVSNDAAYGADLTIWPENFAQYVEAYLAVEICMNLTQSSSKKDEVMTIKQQRLDHALSTDAMEEPTKFMPIGTWAGARLSGRRGWGNGSR